MFSTASNLHSASGLSADQINAVLTGKGVLASQGQAIAAVEKKHGINAIFCIAQAAEESGWGSSPIARDKNNVFGITAYDSNPYGSATSFDSVADCIAYWGDFIDKQYLTPGGAYYVSPTPAGVGRHWASDFAYATKIVQLMNQIAVRAGLDTSEAATAYGPVPNGTAAKEYKVKQGDNMWQIANDNGLTLAQIESMNPHAGHPAGNFNIIWPNDILAIGLPNYANQKPAASNTED